MTVQEATEWVKGISCGNCTQCKENGCAIFVLCENSRHAAELQAKIDSGELVEVVRGQWAFDAGVDYCWKCDKCNRPAPFNTGYSGSQNKTPYCPNCGAKIDGGQHD